MSATETVPLPVLAPDGYDDGAPPHVLAGALDADRQTAAEMECPECGAKGLAFRPFRGPGPNLRYRALAVCRCGGFCEEI